MGKIVKNIILILIGFLLITAVYAALVQTPKVTTVPISDITTLLNQGKVESLTVTDSDITAKIKDSDTQEQAKITPGADVVGFFKNTGVDVANLAPDKVKIEYDNGSLASNLAQRILPFLIPFVW